jgi:hypothetical protein
MRGGGHRRKSTNDREGSLCRNYDAASGKILRISKGFNTTMDNFISIFLFNQAS